MVTGRLWPRNWVTRLTCCLQRRDTGAGDRAILPCANETPPPSGSVCLSGSTILAMLRSAAKLIFHLGSLLLPAPDREPEDPPEKEIEELSHRAVARH
jgi:hypothetical protein